MTKTYKFMLTFTKKIEEYIRNQLKEDQAAVQLSIDFDGDPFDG